MSDDKEGLVLNTFKALQDSFQIRREKSDPLPSIISKYAANLELFSSKFDSLIFFQKIEELISKEEEVRAYNSKKYDNIKEVMHTIKLLEAIAKIHEAVKRRSHPFSHLAVMTQLDLYSRIVHEDNYFLALLYIIEWLEEIFEISSEFQPVIVDFKNTARAQKIIPMESKISMDLDGIMSAPESLMDPSERKQYKDLLKHVFYLVRKGLVSQAEELLSRCCQSAKAATLIGGLPAHLFELSDEQSEEAKDREIQDWYVPRSIHTSDSYKAFKERYKAYKQCNKNYSRHIGNNDWILWLHSAYAHSSSKSPAYYKDEIGVFDRAIYGALSGNKAAMLEMCDTWHDRLWANLKAHFISEVTKRFCSRRGDYAILFAGHPIELLTNLPTEGISAMPDILSNEEGTVFEQLQKILLKAVLEPYRGFEYEQDQWNSAIICTITMLERLVSCNEENRFYLEYLVVHILIVLLLDGRIAEEVQSQYTKTILNYSQQWSFNREVQFFYGNFVLQEETIVNFFSDQFINVESKEEKIEILNCFNKNYSKQKTVILDRIWSKSFGVPNEDNALINSLFWFLLDKENTLKGFKMLLKLCRYFLANERVKSACSLYSYFFIYQKKAENKIKIMSLPLMYDDSSDPEAKNEIVYTTERLMMLEELRAIQALIEVVDAWECLVNSRGKNSLVIKEQNISIQKMMCDKISHLLFEGNTPIINDNVEIVEARRKMLPPYEEDKDRSNEIARIIELYTGRLLKWDIEISLEMGDLSQIWDIIEVMEQRNFFSYIKDYEEIKDILCILSEVCCSSRDIMETLFQ